MCTDSCDIKPCPRAIAKPVIASGPDGWTEALGRPFSSLSPDARTFAHPCEAWFRRVHCHVHASVRKGAPWPRQDLSVTPLHPCYWLRRGRVFITPTRRALRRWRRRACAHGKLSVMQLARSLLLLALTVVTAREDVLQQCTKVEDADGIVAALASSPTGSASVCLSGASDKCDSPSRDNTARGSDFLTEGARKIAIAAAQPAVVHSARDLTRFCRNGM